MKVVLLKPRKKLGNIGDIIEVKNGYARNFLIPEHIATRATKENLLYFENKKSTLEQNNSELKILALKYAEKISGSDFTFISQASDDGRLFGSVTAKDIAKEVNRLHSDYRLDYSKVVLDMPIKSLGLYEISLHLHNEVDTKILINVARSDNEAREALKNFKTEKTDPVDQF
ncbi:MAG: 50S ribosomal protein L9 [Rickettsiaceae bacterium]|nr:50S ribosomal protein L9 [Rickettsiaceae bacterium]